MQPRAPELSTAVVDEFKKIDVSCIGDVLVGLGLRCISHGVYPLTRNMTVCGPAVTLRQVSSRDRRNWARHEQVLVEHCRPGNVLVIDMGGRTDGGTWGGNITVEAQRRGLAGVVIDGATRDSEEIIQAGFPTFVRGVTLRHTHGTFYSCCLNNEPIQIGGPPFQAMVFPGDLVIGNADGVLVVPAERAEEILELSMRRQQLDLQGKELRRSGKGYGDPDLDAHIARVRELEGVVQAAGYKW